MSSFTGHHAERSCLLESVPTQAGQPFGSLPRAHEPDWHSLPDALQLVLAQQAMRRAAATLAEQAELLAHEMDAGTLTDHGGSDALRLFAAIIRSSNSAGLGPVGHA